MEPLEQKINELTHNEGVLIKQLADQEIASNEHKILFESSRKEANTLKVKLSGTKKELEQKTQRCFNQEQEIAELALKAESVSGVMEREKNIAIKEMKSKYEMELQDMKLSLVNKQLTIKEKEAQLLNVKSELQDKNQQAVQLSEMSNKLAKLEMDHQKAKLKCRELKISEKENTKKLEVVEAENQRLQKKYEELKKKKVSSSSSSEQNEEICLIKRENLDLKSKLAIQQKSLRSEIDRLVYSKNKTEKKISKMERKLKDSESKLSSSSSDVEENNHTVRKLERENRRLREDDEYNRKVIRDLREERNKLNDQMRTSEVEARRDVETLNDRIKKLEGESVESEKNRRMKVLTRSDKEASSPPSLQQQNDQYSYEDDFEPESIAKDDVSSKDDKSVTEKESLKEKIREVSVVKDEEVHAVKYEGDTFEEESVATFKSSSFQECLSIVEGESCEESVPEIESDNESVDLFFGSKNVSLDIPKFSASVASSNRKSIECKVKVAAANKPGKSFVGEHAQKKELAPPSAIDLFGAPRLTKKEKDDEHRQQKSLVSLSDAPL